MKTLLLAESHPATLEHLSAALAQAGYTVRTVTDPGKAVEHFVVDRPDAVLMVMGQGAPASAITALPCASNENPPKVISRQAVPGALPTRRFAA